MTSYFEKLEHSLWNMLEGYITSEEEALQLEETIRLLELEPQEVNREIESNKNLRQILKLENLEEDISEPDTESEEEEPSDIING